MEDCEAEDVRIRREKTLKSAETPKAKHLVTLRHQDRDSTKYGLVKSLIIKPGLLHTPGSQQFQFLAGMKNWSEIPPLSIITGNNGEGKSLLLKYAQQVSCIQSYSVTKSAQVLLQKHEVILVENPAMNFGSWGSSSGRDPNYYLRKISERPWLKRMAEYLASEQGQLLGDNIEQGIIKSMRKDIEAGILVLNEDILLDIRRYAEKYLPLEMDKIRVSDPVSFLSYIFNIYNLRLEYLKREYQELKNIRTLFEFYKDTNLAELQSLQIEVNLGLEEFLAQVIEVDTEKEKFLDHFVLLRAGINPVDEVNTILESNRFKYRIAFSKDSSGSYDYNLRFIKDGSEIHPHRLSSGEKSMMTLLSMLYATNLPNAHGTANNPFVKLILLDEFDAHFDPSFCKTFLKVVKEEFVVKRGIQVIMATHRLDTVKLAPDDDIFVLQQDGEEQREVVNCHKLQAMFRMTKNLREITGFHVDVYTESARDANFYEGVYHALLATCSEIREKRIFESKPSKYMWNLGTPEGHIARILSDRYQMNFVQTSSPTQKHGDRKAEGNGGCNAVKKAILCDQSQYKRLAAQEGSHGLLKGRSLFKEPELHQSYGILDNDYSADHGLKKAGLAEDIVRGKRHSIESFICDPIIMCSVLSKEQLSQAIMQSQLPRLGKGQHEKQKLLEHFLDLGDELNKDFEDINQAKLQGLFEECMNDIFEIMHQVLHKIMKTVPPKAQRTDAALEKFLAKSKDVRFTEEIPMFVQDKVIYLRYPTEFYDLRGHDVEDYFLSTKNKISVDGTDLTYSSPSLIGYLVKTDGLKYIPFDLAEIFFKLNISIRKNICKAIKPSKVIDEDFDNPFNLTKEEEANVITTNILTLTAPESGTSVSYPRGEVYLCDILGYDDTDYDWW